MATMNTCAPVPEIKLTYVVIHPSKPDLCPECQAEVVSRCEKAAGTDDNVVAFRCSGIGHRIHAFKGIAL
jgi:hypothetical protein